VAAIREKAKKFHKFVKGLQEKYPQALPDEQMKLLERFIFYLLFYSNPVTNAHKAFKALTDDKHFASWSEVRVATVRELTNILRDSKVEPAEFLAPRLKELLQNVFEEVDDVALEPLTERIEEAQTAKQKKDAAEKVRKFVTELPGIPPWGPQYLLAGLGLDPQLPLDPHTEAVLEAQKCFPPKSKLPEKKRVAKALLDGLEPLGPIEVHHLLVEHAKRDGAGGKKG